MYATKQGMLKIVTIVLGLIVTAVGCAAHFNSAAKDALDGKYNHEGCKLVEGCPSNAMAMEKFFVSISIICLLLSLISLVAGFLMDLRGVKLADGGYHIVAGVFVLIAGILLITSAVQIDNFFVDIVNGLGLGGFNANSNPFTKAILKNFDLQKASLQDEIIKELRKELKFPDKLAAGALSIINGVIYLAASGIIFKS